MSMTLLACAVARFGSRCTVSVWSVRISCEGIAQVWERVMRLSQVVCDWRYIYFYVAFV